jgi:hypothetical protein
MVIRLDQTNRQGINDLKNLYVSTPMENKFAGRAMTIDIQRVLLKYLETIQIEESLLELTFETEICKVL